MTKKDQDQSKPAKPVELEDEQLDQASGGIWNFHVWNEGIKAPAGPSPTVGGGTTKSQP